MKALVLIAALAAPLSAHADEIIPKARVLAERGRMLHAAGNYVGAIDAFREAYVIAPSPALLFNLAQAYRLQGACEDARIMYQRYLGSDPPPEGRQIAESQLAIVEKCARDRAPLTAPRLVAASAVTAHPPAMSVVETSAPGSTSGQIQRDIGIGVMIGGGVVLATAVYYAVQASRAASDVSAAYAMGASGKDIAPIDARGRSAATDAKLLGVGGALVIGGGVALYLLGDRSEQARAVAIVPTRTGGGVNLSWKF